MAGQAAIRVLNISQDKSERKIKTASESLELSKKMQKLIKRVKGEYMMADFVDYSRLKTSEMYKEFQETVEDLPSIDLDALNTQQLKAFFIKFKDVFNTLTIHGIISLDKLPESVMDVRQFWRTTAYKIGEHVFSLDDIEHGILRGNRSHPASKGPHYFKDGDPRTKFSMKSIDPRIHFALNCGAKSCPVVSAYSEDNLDLALDDATRSFCSQEVIVLPKNEEVYVSKLFEWYERDFGDNDLAAIRWTLPYIESTKKADLTILLQGIQSVGQGRILYNEYDWSLNSTFR